MTGVYLEAGTRRVFACAVDRPGWCRSGRGEEHALEALATAASRYAVPAAPAVVPFDPVTEMDCLTIAWHALDHAWEIQDKERTE